MKRLTGARRVAVLAVSALLCAVVSAASVVGNVLADPFVRPIVLALGLGAGVLGFCASLLLLWDVNLAKTVPLVFIATVLGAYIGGVIALSGPVLGLGFGVFTMQWCRRWAFRPPVSPNSVFRDHLKGLARRSPHSNRGAS